MVIIIRKLIEFSEQSKNEKIVIKILKLIFNNIDLLDSKEHKDYALNKIKSFNEIKKGIQGEIIYNFHAEKKIIEEYSRTDICILLENFILSNVITIISAPFLS